MIRRLADEVNGMTLKFLPAATTEISVVEIYRREIKCKMPDVPCINLDRLCKVIAQYTRHTKPNLSVEKILWSHLREHVILHSIV